MPAARRFQDLTVCPQNVNWKVKLRNFIQAEVALCPSSTVQFREERMHFNFLRVDDPDQLGIFRIQQFIPAGIVTNADNIQDEVVFDLLKARLGFDPLLDKLVYCVRNERGIGRPLLIDQHNTISLISLQAYCRREMPVQFYICRDDDANDAGTEASAAGKRKRQGE